MPDAVFRTTPAVGLDVRDIRGVGLRPAHYPHWHAQRDDLPWLEIMADNYLFQRGGPGLAHLDRLAARARCLVHGVGLSIASHGELDADYLRELRALCERVNAHVVSDHLCFTRASGRQSYDLLPIPYTETMLRHVAERVSRVQDALGRRFALENVSSYVSFPESELSEMEFLRELCARTGCGIVLDVNNVHVSAVNHGHDARAELAAVEPSHVMQFHVAGHCLREGFLHDTHDQPVDPVVWDLCAFALARVGPRPFVLENDDDQAHAEDVVSELDAGLARIAREVSRHALAASSDRARVGLPPLARPAACLGEGASPTASLAWQDDFIACVQSPVPAAELLAAAPALAARLLPSTSHRIDVYRVGYFSRVTATLAGTLFERASVLLSEDYVRGVLGRYFERHPATAPSLTASCAGVPDFAETLPDVHEKVPWLPDFLRLCLARWKVLTGVDPTAPSATLPEPATTHLQRSAALVVSQHPIFALWNLADGDEPPLDHGQAVLLFKSAPTDLEMVLVAPEHIAVVSDLVREFSIAQAIEALDDRGEDLDPEGFGKLLAGLARRNAWTG